MATQDLRRRNRRLLLRLGGVVVGMSLFAWLLVPLYRLVCERLGVGTVSQRPSLAALPPGAGTREVTVRLMGIVAAGARARMEPVESRVTVPVGARREVSYRFENLSDRPLDFQVVHAVDPPAADARLHKLVCFCFQRQRLGAREQRLMPVSFWIDPALAPGIRELTLSYTLFALHPEAPASTSPEVPHGRPGS